MDTEASNRGKPPEEVDLARLHGTGGADRRRETVCGLPCGGKDLPRTTSLALPQLRGTPLAGGSAELAERPGLEDLRVALVMVASGQARSLTLCGFASGERLLRIARDAGGGIDIRVRRAASSRA